MKEKELKRKRELEGEGDNVSDLDGTEKEKPWEGMKTKTSKKQKLDHAGDSIPKSVNVIEDGMGEPQQKKSRAEKRKEKTQRKREKLVKKEEKVRAKQARKEASKQEAREQQAKQPNEEPVEDEAVTSITPLNDIEAVDVTGLTDDVPPPPPPRSTASPSPAPGSTFSHASAQPSTSSTSSAPVSETPAPKPKLLPADREALKSRLEAKIAALRALRKADGPDGRPARSRQELIEARRKKQELRKQHKKELRKQAREEEVRAQAEAELARLRGSGSPLGSPGDIFSPGLARASPDSVGDGLAYGRVVWGDGGRISADGLRVEEPRKRKGPADPRTALEATERKRARLEGMEEGKRKDVEEKDAWLNAKKRVHGERVRDDTSLLKKALKRKEQQKRKSEREWGERIKGVEKGIEMRQKKREDNLRKRKEEKGGKGKGAKPSAVAKKKVKRPGFEGSFRARSKK
jgi:hypothetical protein